MPSPFPNPVSVHVLVSDPATDDSWPEILGGLFQLSLQPEAEKRETAFRVFATTPGIISGQHEDAVLQAFNKGFKDDAVTVRSPFWHSKTSDRSEFHADPFT